MFTMLFKFNAGEISQTSFVCAAPPEKPFTSTALVLFLPYWLHFHVCEPVTLIDVNPDPGVPETEQLLKLKLKAAGFTASPERSTVFETAPVLLCVILPVNTPTATGENFT